MLAAIFAVLLLFATLRAAPPLHFRRKIPLHNRISNMPIVAAAAIFAAATTPEMVAVSAADAAGFDIAAIDEPFER